MARQKKHTQPKSTTKKETAQKTPEVPSAQITLSKRSLVVGLVSLLAAVVVISILIPTLLNQYNNDAAKAARVTEKVSKVFLLPQGDPQTVIEVSDVATLKNTNPDFYANVEKGDFLLMYPDRAIIYRESSNQVVNVAQIKSTQKKSQ